MNRAYWQVAARVAQEKRLNPERFCTIAGCLWRVEKTTGDSPCKRHPNAPRYTDIVRGTPRKTEML